jgi:hypothetical protein
MWATLRIVVGPSAKSATTASVGTVSLIAFMSMSIPRTARPVTVIDSSGPSSHATVQPMRPSASAKPTSPCMLRRESPSTRTLPPLIAAAARK